MNNLTRNRKQKRKISKKTTCNKSRIVSVGGGEEGISTIFTIITNPMNELHDNFVMKDAFACIKIEFGVNINFNENVENLEGGAQVCSHFYNNRTPPHETYSRIIRTKLLGQANKIACGNHLADLLANVSTGPQGLDLLGPHTTKRLVMHITEPSATGIYINLYQLDNCVIFGAMPHVSFHFPLANPSGNFNLNSNVGVSHIEENPGRVKIVWRLCAQSSCDQPDVPLQQVPPLNYVTPHYALSRNDPPHNQIRYFINTDITPVYLSAGRDSPLPSKFYMDLIKGLRNYLLEGININGPAFTNDDISLKQHLSGILENTCSDINDDRLIEKNELKPASNISSNIKQNYSRRTRGKFSIYPYPDDAVVLADTLKQPEYTIQGVDGAKDKSPYSNPIRTGHVASTLI